MPKTVKTKPVLKTISRQTKPQNKPKSKSKPTRKTTSLTSKDYPRQSTVVKKPVKGVKWAVNEPKGAQRIKLNKVCPKCILVKPKPSAPKTVKQDPKNYKFPVCSKLTKNSKSCKLNCTGVLAANRRARLTKKYPDVQKLTGELLQKFKCTKASVEREKKALVKKQQKHNRNLEAKKNKK